MTNREVEHKFAAKAHTLEEAVRSMKELLSFNLYLMSDSEALIVDPRFSCKPYQVGKSHDYYWESPTSDFLRLRRNLGSESHTLTTKTTDKGDSIDREEINVTIPQDQFQNTKQLLRSSLGREHLKFVQEYALFRPQPTLPSLIISVYTISISGLVFIEVEGPTLGDVERWSSVIHRLTTKQYYKSLWDLFRPGAP